MSLSSRCLLVELGLGVAELLLLVALMLVDANTVVVVAVGFDDVKDVILCDCVCVAVAVSSVGTGLISEMRSQFGIPSGSTDGFCMPPA